MSALTANPPPAIPPRPSRSQEKQSAPMVPPRPANRRVQRSISPNPDRFAPSPLNETAFLKSPRSLRPSSTNGHNGHNGDSIPRPTSVELPSLGEEGREYAGLAEELSAPKQEAASPEQTRTVAEDLKLHAPKPSLPAASAKQRVMAVTRTDSERAASFGIGRPSSMEESSPALPSNRSLKKKASTASQLSTTDRDVDDEHGIPEIGQQVPMYPNAGDVQAPSPAPSSAQGKHHARRPSARGNLPPGSYGLHGHGVAPQDKLEKAYYEKHPDLLKKEHVPHHYDRPNDFSMSSDDLNKIVRETASRGSGLGVKNYAGTPSDQVGWEALEESASRIASPGIASPKLKPARKPSSTVSDSDNVIHVEEPNRRKSVMFSDSESIVADEEIHRPYTAPILADDEVAKDPSPHAHQPAVEPPAFELDEPSSRPTSRPASLHKETSFELRSTPLEDVEEYEPLFKDDEKPETKKPTVEEKAKRDHPHRFPSADIWEDAPSSVFYTAEVSTPELFDEQEKPSKASLPDLREGETPAQAFARHQEELAEREARGQATGGGTTQKPVWAMHQKHLASEVAPQRPAMQHRFPSQDVWEDTPDSLKLETTVSTPQQDELPSPSPADNPILERPQPTTAEAPAQGDKPSVPERPRPRQASGDDKPAVPERPKPQVPARPAKVGPTSAGLEPAEAAAPPRPKPAVPARPVGSKIAALQAGFMNDLNRRLQLGPQAPPKREEPAAASAEEPAEEKADKVPLSDARKGRARGPQRRAPTAAAGAASAPSDAKAEPTPAAAFAFSAPLTFFEIDPDEGVVSAGGAKEAIAVAAGKEIGEAKAEEPSSVPAPVPVDEEEGAAAVAATASDAAAAQPRHEPQPESAGHAGQAECETKSLATNMAGETLVTEEVKRDEEHQDAVEPVKVVEN